MAEIVWTRQSREDLDAIEAFIARDAPLTAAQFVTWLVSSVTRLEKLPFSGAVVLELGREHIREIVRGNYRIIYQIRDDRVAILSVYHAARMLDEDSIPGLGDE